MRHDFRLLSAGVCLGLLQKDEQRHQNRNCDKREQHATISVQPAIVIRLVDIDSKTRDRDYAYAILKYRDQDSQ